MSNEKNMEGPKQAPFGELCDQALVHYEQISNKANYWNSLVPDAIKFYRDNKQKLADFQKDLDKSFHAWKFEYNRVEVLEDRLEQIKKELEHLINEEINSIELCEYFVNKIQKEFSIKSSDLNTNKIRLRELTIDFDTWKVMRDISKENLDKLKCFKETIQ